MHFSRGEAPAVNMPCGKRHGGSAAGRDEVLYFFIPSLPDTELNPSTAFCIGLCPVLPF
jgi:hypothetical protein